MPLGIQRLNARPSSHPTPHVGFIKPLPGPGTERARQILSRVAAICHPILAEHHLAVMTLEEHEPNREFLGRNFNAGEVIQLVLRRRKRTIFPYI
jgi:DNA-dependent metalloprotease WSS1